MEKKKAIETIALVFSELQNDYKQSNSLPTDRKITKLADAFYHRDRDRQIGADVEGMAVMRGIIQGMQLMRQIIEG